LSPYVKTSLAAFVLYWLSVPMTARAETFSAKVISVIDGDTVMVQQGNKKTTVRLAGIDAPEKRQPWGSESRSALTKLVLRKEVRVTTTAIDAYGRVVAILEVGGAFGAASINVNEAQIRSGMAWEYSHYHADKTLIALQSEAQRARLGLWQQMNPQPPWEFRKGQTGMPAPAQANPACGSKRYCSQMVSCEEATFYLTQCGAKKLDKNGDGVPCENLCDPKSRRHKLQAGK
jgi:endonuclease YncB( thermonuclease family)